MEHAWPKLPINEGVQSNCWKLVLILGYLNYFLTILTAMINGEWNNIFSTIINIIFFTMYQYHSLYYTIEITEEIIEIKGGPCQWCLDWNNKDDWKKFLSAAWCFSSQIYKSDIVSIETRVASFWPDWFPRYYCAPVMWCCCHKSYNGWYFPLCCNNINVAGLCDGDIGPVTHLKYVQFNLSEKGTNCLFPNRISINPWSCFTYNRISYVLRDPSIVDQLKQCGYDVNDIANGSANISNNNNNNDTTTTTGQPIPVTDAGTAGSNDPPPSYPQTDNAAAADGATNTGVNAVDQGNDAPPTV